MNNCIGRYTAVYLFHGCRTQKMNLRKYFLYFFQSSLAFFSAQIILRSRERMLYTCIQQNHLYIRKMKGQIGVIKIRTIQFNQFIIFSKHTGKWIHDAAL